MRDTLQEGEKNQWKGVKKKKVASLLGFLTPSIPGMGKKNIALGDRPGRCQRLFFFLSLSLSLQLILKAGWGNAFFLLEENDLIEVFIRICVGE